MISKRWAAALVMALVCLSVLCTGAYAQEAAITFDAELVEVAKGGSAKIGYIVEGDEEWGKISKKVWSSSDKSVAAVSDGKVTGKGLGEASVTLTLKYKNGQELTANVPVEVFAPLKTIELDKEKLTAAMGDAPVTLTVSLSPDTAKYQTVTWSTSDEKVAVVDENGVVTFVGGGTATITATSDQPKDAKGKMKSASCKVTVTQRSETVTLNETSATVAKGNSLTLTATVGPEGTTDKSVTWTSSNPDVAKVDKKGKITAKSTGTATVTATANDGSGASASCEVTVIQAVKKVSIKTSKMAITNGKSKSLSAAVTPSDATDRSLTWTSSNSGVASVDANGKVTAKRTGTTTITATANDGSGKSASVKVTVEPTIPVYFNGISRGVFYRNRLFINVHNANKTRTVKRFDFTVNTYSYADKLIGTEYCFWQKKIGPNKSKSSGSWHWEVYGLSRAAKVKVTVTDVYYTDGTHETIPYDSRYTQSFGY